MNMEESATPHIVFTQSQQLPVKLIYRFIDSPYQRPTESPTLEAGSFQYIYFKKVVDSPYP
jgi:hypothetical protein